MEQYNTLAACREAVESKSRERFSDKLDTSGASEWGLWIGILSYCIWIFNNILNLFKRDVEASIQSKKMFLLPWYAKMIKEFQLGDSLVTDKSGITSYPVVDEKKRIIKHVTIRETTEGLSIKVAKEIDDNGVKKLAPLNRATDEFIQFKRYVENRKAPGTKIEYISLGPDVIYLDADIYYDSLYIPMSGDNAVDSVKGNVLKTLEEYKESLGYEGIIYVSDLEKRLSDTDGVVTAKINLIKGTQGSAVTTFDVAYILKSGYFNFDDSVVVNMHNSADFLETIN